MRSSQSNQKQLLTAYKQNYINSTSILSTANAPSSSKQLKDFKLEHLNISTFDPDSYKKRGSQSKNSVLVQEVNKKKQRGLDDFQKKFQILQRHNTHLLAQNNSLTEMLAQKNNQMQILSSKFEIQLRNQANHINQIQQDKIKLAQQLESKHFQHRNQIDKLLEQISKLHDQCYSIESSKSFQIQKMKQTFQKETYTQIQNLKRSQNANIQLYQTQIRKLKQSIQIKNFELQSFVQHNKLNIDKLNEQIKHYQAQIKHLNQMRELQLQQCRIHYENEIHNKIRQIQRDQQIQTNNIQNNIRKLKKQLAQKILQIQRLSNTMTKTNLQNDSQIQLLKQQKQKLKIQIGNLEEYHKQASRKQKQRMNNMSEAEKQNIQNTNINYANSLKSQIQKLYQLTQYKTSEIQQLYNQMDSLKKTHSKEIDYLNNLITQFKNKLQDIQLSTHQQLEVLKVKMAHLHEADIKSLKQYYQNQLKLLAEQILAQQKIIQQNRQKLHKQLQQKNQIRKLFQIEISKQKSKYADLKLKFNAANLDMKQQINTFTSKMELTSQTLLRQTKLKQKGTNFHEEQKRKLHQLITIKDNEMKQILRNMDRLKQQTTSQIDKLKGEIKQLKKFNQQTQNILKKQHNFYQNQLKKRQILFKRQIQDINKQKNQSKATIFNEFKNLLQNLQKQKLKLQNDLQHNQRQRSSLAHELAVKNGLIQTLHLQSSAAFQDQKTKMKGHWSKNQEGLRKYYQQKVKSRQIQLSGLKSQLNEKQQDLRDVILKYNGLQKRLAAMMQSQQKLRDFQTKVVNLGMDSNLIKNLAQLFKNKK